jgi:hypothetical protein
MDGLILLILVGIGRLFYMEILAYDRVNDLLLFLLLYINQLPYSGSYPKFNMYHPTPIGATHAFCLLYMNQLPGVERTQNILYIIQLSPGVEQKSTACISRVYPRCIIYHPTLIGATRAFRLLYQSTACSGSYPKFIMYHPTPIGAARAFCLLYQSTACSGAYPKYIMYHP